MIPPSATPAAPDLAAVEHPAFTVMPLRFTEDAPAMGGQHLEVHPRPGNRAHAAAARGV